MIRFNNDYSEVGHERILKKLADISGTQVGTLSERPMRTYIFLSEAHRQTLRLSRRL